jgi:glycosyltransferase involved in cell wall biosynthesis
MEHSRETPHDRISPHRSQRADETTVQRRRICFAIETLDVGGAETHAVTVAEYLKQRGWQVVFAVMREAGPLARRCRAADIEVCDRLMPSRRGRGVIKRFGQLAAERPFDVLFVVECFYLNALLAYRAAKRQLGARAFAVIHNWPSRREFSHPALLRPRVALMNRIFDRIVFIAESQRRHYEQRLGIRFLRTEVIPSGIDLERFAPAASARDRDRHSESKDARRPLRVGIVASLQPRKGHDVFLRAAAEILGHGSEVEFLIVGDGPRRVELDRLAHDLNIKSHVQFLGVRNDVADLLRTLDVLVLASHEKAGGHAETLPLVLMEAGATALPVVATNVGAVPDIVVDGRTGFLVPQRDPKALAERIDLLLGDLQLRERMGTLARERIAADFDARHMCRSFERLFLSGQ